MGIEGGLLDSLPRLRRGTAVGSQEFENDGDIHPREHQEFTKDKIAIRRSIKIEELKLKNIYLQNIKCNMKSKESKHNKPLWAYMCTFWGEKVYI